mmetsp:Transcript_58913/g.170929  ORF Transcript_58913/g.170929 Transcript_58913/m.170929 type:complete len:383 (-) Transcript_58913:45-1193(-)
MDDQVLDGAHPSSGEQNKDSEAPQDEASSSNAKTRFNWKHRYLTTHSASGSDGQLKVVYNFLHDENEEDLMFIRMLLGRRPWEAPSNQVTSTWQAFADALRVQQDSKGNYPFKNIAVKTLRSRFSAYLGLEQFWTEKVDPDDSNDDGDTGTNGHSNEIRNGINDIFEMVRNFNGAKMAAKDEQKVKEWAEKGQVDEMKARALLHLDRAFDGAVAASKTAVLSDNRRSVDDSRADTPSSVTTDNMSRNGTPDTQNPTVTPSRRPGSTRKGAGNNALFELDKVQRNFQELKEKKLENRLEIQREREKRKLQEAETAKMEQENTRLRLEMQNSQFQANMMMQQQLMQQQQQMQQQMMEFITRLTSGSTDKRPNDNREVEGSNKDH